MEKFARLARATATVCAFLVAIVSFSSVALAKTKLIVLEDGVKVFSGPGTYYRALTVLKAKTELVASNGVIENDDGKFYRVVVKLSEKKNAIGFIPVNPNVRLTGDVDPEEIEKYGEVALIDSALQAQYSLLQNDMKMWAFGYLRYVTPGFYVKGYGGQLHAPNAAGGLFATEVGNDALLIGRISGETAIAAGIFTPETTGTFFEGSSKINAFVQATFGLRYNFSGLVSVSVAATQLAIFNQNNSLVTRGGLVSLEVGL